jgi:Flp pilus assembly protein TadD
MNLAFLCRRALNAVAILCLLPQFLAAQSAGEHSQASHASEHDLSKLGLNPSRRTDLEKSLNERDYKKAETILLEEAGREPNSLRAATLLEFAGGIFFLDREYLKAAIAWKKAEAVAPLDERSSFTLAMAYIKLHRAEGAQLELEKLATAQPRNPLYLYWLARLDYDSQKYAEAIGRLRRVTQLDPTMTRAYNLLGLCYDYLGRMDEAITSFTSAVELNRAEPQPSPWPNLDMANSQIELNQLPEAEKNLREAVGYDARLPKARYYLGLVLEKEGKYNEALQALKDAAALDPAYAEPHYLLGRIYQRLGQSELAKNEIQRFQDLKKRETPVASSSTK